MEDSVCLIAVVNGKAYERYAEQLFASAREHFRTGYKLQCVALPGRAGWPDATMFRYHVILEHFEELPYRWLYLCDADMLFVAKVGAEVIPRGSSGLVATRHPGYVGRTREEFPYETDQRSLAYIGPDEGGVYICGGFVGGERMPFKWLAESIIWRIDSDQEAGITPRWHDESVLNRVLITNPPDHYLSPSYCMPQDSTWYTSFWPENYPKKLLALDKTTTERGER